MKSCSHSSAVKLKYQLTTVVSDFNVWQEELKDLYLVVVKVIVYFIEENHIYSLKFYLVLPYHTR